MKRIFKYILALAAAGALGSCMKDSALNNGGDAPGGPVTLDFSVTIPDIQSVQTRGLLDEAAGEGSDTYLGSLLPYIFIFEDTGNSESNYLRSLVYGSQVDNTGTSEKDTEHSTTGVDVQLKTFSATVDGTAEKAIIHLVLIHEKEKEQLEYKLTQMTDRSEIGMFTGAAGLRTSSAAYWCRIPLGVPINKKTKETDDFKKKLSHIKMVRNFAQVTVTSKAPNFKVTGFVIVNGMDCGYVAAYNENTVGNDNFIDFSKSAEGKEYYEFITKDVGYLPIRHPYSLRNNADNKVDEWIDTATDELKNGETWGTVGTAKYMFERPLQETRMTCVLLRGEYTATGTTDTKTGYYKLDIGAYDDNESHKEGDYIGYGVYEMYHLIRNISYDIVITDAASAGHDSADSAIAGPPANNLTASVQTRNVLTMGDGVDEIGVTVYTGDEYKDKVDGTTVVIVDAEVKDDDGKIIGYKPYPDKAKLTWFYKDGDGKDPAVYLSTINYSHTGYELKDGSDGIINEITWKDGTPGNWTQQDDGNWYGCELKFNTPTDIPQREVVRLYKPFGLSRDVTFVLRKRWEFVTDTQYPSNIEVYPGSYSFDTNTMPSEKLNEVRRLIPGPGNVGSSRGAQLTVMFELPSDIPQELFPLDFKIGFDRQNVDNAYTGNAVVIYGDTMFDDDEEGYKSDEPRMQFVKTVTWDYYNGSGDYNDSGHKIVTARFQTTTDVMDNNAVGEESRTRVRVYNPYFILGEDDFTREVNPTDPDPNQTMWLWYFGDIGWQNYFSTNNTGSNRGTANTYNELWFNDYKFGNQYGPYIGMTYGRSATNPDFRFNVNSTGNTAKLTITATSETYQTNSNNRFRRSCHAQVYYDDGTSDYYNFGEITKRDPSDKGMPGEVTWEFDPKGKTISNIVIWNEKGTTSSTEKENENTWALYYSIRFELK